MSSYIIEAHQVSRWFDETPAVQHLNLQVQQGKIYALLGRNGAGKTTTIKMLAGLIWPDEGDLLVSGMNPKNFTLEDRRKIAYLSEKQALPLMIRVGKLIQFCSNFYPNWDFELSDRVLKRFKIDPNQKIKSLSQGGARQVGLLLALAQNPDLLLLDEPAGGLDVVARHEFLDEVLDLIRQEGKTVFFSSHILSDVERIADEVGIISHGNLKISEPLDRLKDTIKQVRFFGFSKGIDRVEIHNAFRVRRFGEEALATMRVEDKKTLDQIAAQHGCRYEVFGLSLEDIFVEIVREFS